MAVLLHHVARALDCPLVYSQFGLNGWRRWTLKSRQTMRYCTYRNAPRKDVGAIKYTTAMVDTMVLSLAFLDAGAQ